MATPSATPTNLGRKGAAMIRQRNISRRPLNVGVINQELWSAHGR